MMSRFGLFVGLNWSVTKGITQLSEKVPMTSEQDRDPSATPLSLVEPLVRHLHCGTSDKADSKDIYHSAAKGDNSASDADI